MLDLNDASPPAGVRDGADDWRPADIEQRFIEEMAKRGLVPPKRGIIPDGKPHRCDTCATRWIKTGQQYLESTVFPDHDTGIADMAGHPLRLRECFSCAERYGRDHLFTDDDWSCRA